MVTSIEDKPELHITAVDLPQIARFRTVLHRSGIDGLLAAGTQTEPGPPAGVRGTFAAYHPDPGVVATQPLDDVVFSPTEPAGPYNWELFFHVALSAGAALTRNHQFAQARRWFHYVFDPTDSSGGPTPDRYWRFRSFCELHDIKRMEVSYVAENRRELEIVKHVSLRQLDGAALLRLRSEGTCEFELPEAFFDLDFPATTSAASRASASPSPALSGRTPVLTARSRCSPARCVRRASWSAATTPRRTT